MVGNTSWKPTSAKQLHSISRDAVQRLKLLPVLFAVVKINMRLVEIQQILIGTNFKCEIGCYGQSQVAQ
jgi:hypothetical protein